MNVDVVNGTFEGVGGILGVISIIKLSKDKVIKGVSWFPTLFFTVWGIWNLFYYPMLNQHWSFVGGIILSLTNCTWVIMAIYYSSRQKM